MKEKLAVVDAEFAQIMDIINSLLKADKTALAASQALEELLRMQQEQILEVKAQLINIATRVKALEIVEQFNDLQSNAGKA